MIHLNEALTPRETEVARLTAVECLSAKEVAKRLGTGWRTVEKQRQTIFAKLGMRNAVELARYMALAENIASSPPSDLAR